MNRKYEPKIGDVVVLFDWTGHPVQHNSPQSAQIGGSGCRGQVVKIGRKWVHISTIGAPFKAVANEDGENFFVIPVDQARERHRKNFQGPNEWRSAEFIEDILNEM